MTQKVAPQPSRPRAEGGCAAAQNPTRRPRPTRNAKPAISEASARTEIDRRPRRPRQAGSGRDAAPVPSQTHTADASGGVPAANPRSRCPTQCQPAAMRAGRAAARQGRIAEDQPTPNIRSRASCRNRDRLKPSASRYRRRQKRRSKPQTAESSSRPCEDQAASRQAKASKLTRRRPMTQAEAPKADAPKPSEKPDDSAKAAAGARRRSRNRRRIRPA